MTKTANGYKVGDAVICNGYDGKVIRVTENNMIEVRLAGGVVCVDPFDTREVWRARFPGAYK